MTRNTHVWPKPWWYRAAERLIPSRCREVPEAQDPDRILLRQVALWKKHVYLQQFASGEDPRWMHSHPWRYCLAIGLWGGYRELRLTGPWRNRRAPYFFVLDNRDIHNVTFPSRGHTSIFIGLGEKTDNKHYFDSNPVTIHWTKHIKRKVKRL